MTTENKLPLKSYYFDFANTGNQLVDQILQEVCWAGKGYHHTECWSDSDVGEKSYIDKIQEAANVAASALNSTAHLEARVTEQYEALNAVLAYEKSSFLGPDAEKNNRKAWLGVMRKIRKALAGNNQRKDV